MKKTSNITAKVSRGFSFGETLLAAFVLSVGLLSVVKLFQVSVTNSIFIRDATIASQLSQEGIELVRNVRDNNYIGGGTGFASFSSNRHCRISVNAPTLSCTATQSTPTQYGIHYSGGQYISTTSATKFRRYLYINYSSSTVEATVKSFVVWSGGALPPSSGVTTDCTIRNKCVYTEAVLTNWKS